MIEGVAVKPIHVIADERGRVIEVLRSDDPLFERFGQVFVSTAYPGVVKAWRRHKRQTSFLAVVCGMARVGLYDDREDSPTHREVYELCAGDHNPVIVRIPPGVWYGYKCVSEAECVVMNIPSRLRSHAEPDEERAPAHGGDIPFDWSRQDR
ncbi:MAG: polysaccharide biosynthesis C-terminal domain-containing protein [Planctomycetota bacterium]